MPNPLAYFAILLAWSSTGATAVFAWIFLQAGDIPGSDGDIIPLVASIGGLGLFIMIGRVLWVITNLMIKERSSASEWYETRLQEAAERDRLAATRDAQNAIIIRELRADLDRERARMTTVTTMSTTSTPPAQQP